MEPTAEECLALRTCEACAEWCGVKGPIRAALFELLGVCDHSLASEVGRRPDHQYDKLVEKGWKAGTAPKLAQIARAKLFKLACNRVALADKIIEWHEGTRCAAVAVKADRVAESTSGATLDTESLDLSEEFEKYGYDSDDAIPDCTLTDGGSSPWSRPPFEVGAGPAKVAVIVNPVSGNKDGLAVMQTVRDVFHQRGIRMTVLVSEYAGHEELLARTAEQKVVCVLGGRGSLSKAITGIMAREDKDEVTVGILPNGHPSGLHLMFELEGALHGAQLVVSGDVRRMDVLRVQDLSTERKLYAVGEVLYGLPAEVLAKDATVKKYVCKYGRKLAMTINSGRSHVYRAELDMPEHELRPGLRQTYRAEADYSAVVVTNSQALFGHRYAPNERLDDGKFGILACRPESREQLRKFFQGRATSWELGLLDYEQVSSLTVRPSSLMVRNHFQLGPGTVVVDGEVAIGAPFQVTCEPLALRVFM